MLFSAILWYLCVSLRTCVAGKEKSLETRVVELENTVKYLLEAERNRPVRILANQDVAFSATIPSTVTNLGVHHHIEYTREVIDTSSSYNPSEGTFAAPVSGVYVFTWSVGTAYQQTELVINGTPIAFLNVDAEDGPNDFGSGSQTVITRVSAGQHVWIRTGASGLGVLEGNNYNSFSGWLLFQ